MPLVHHDNRPKKTQSGDKTDLRPEFLVGRGLISARGKPLLPSRSSDGMGHRCMASSGRTWHANHGNDVLRNNRRALAARLAEKKVERQFARHAVKNRTGNLCRETFAPDRYSTRVTRIFWRSWPL